MTNQKIKVGTNWGYLVIVVVWAFLAGGGILFFSRSVINKITAISQLPEIEKIEEGTANWQTYKSSVMGLSIKHPTDWNFEPAIMAVSDPIPVYHMYFSPESTKLGFAQGLIYKSKRLYQTSDVEEAIARVQDMVKSNPIKYELLEEDKLFLDNTPATRMVYINKMLVQAFYQVFFQKGENIYLIEAVFATSSQDIFLPIISQMLSTFRFLE